MPGGVTKLVCLISDKSESAVKKVQYWLCYKASFTKFINMRGVKRFCTARKTRSLTAAMEWISSARCAVICSRAAAGTVNTVRNVALTMRQSRKESGKWMRGVSGQIIAKSAVNQWSKTRQPGYGGIARRPVSRERIGRGNGHKRPVCRFDSVGRLTMPPQTYRRNRGNVRPCRRCEERRLNRPF